MRPFPRWRAHGNAEADHGGQRVRYRSLMATGYDLVARQRRALADIVEPLTDEQGEVPSLCAGWTVHQTAAHTLTFTHVPMPAFMVHMAKAGFNYDKAATRIAAKLAEENTLAEIAAKLRDRAGKENPIKAFPAEMVTTDVTIHIQDIRRPLGLGTDVDPQAVTTVLDFMTTHKQAKAVVTRGRLDGLELVATDTDWSFGEGERVEGHGEALMMAIAGRDTLDELSGDGVATLRSRS